MSQQHNPQPARRHPGESESHRWAAGRYIRRTQGFSAPRPKRRFPGSAGK